MPGKASRKPVPPKKAPGGKVAGKAAPRATPRPPAKRHAGGDDGNSASRLIDQKIRVMGDWHGETLARMRALILEAEPGITEEVKWRGTPVWSHGGIVCTGEAYAKVVKLTFARGASLPDPSRLFNASLEGKARRAIDIREGERVDAEAFKALVRAAVARNGARSAPPAAKGKPDPRKAKPGATKAKPGAKPEAKPVKLLSGGNPQIAKGDGDAPVQAYIAAMPGWKRDVGRRLDALIVRTVPGVRKAVKWNSPFYGVEDEGRGWFLSFHCFAKYVKVAFFRGASLRPLPPVDSKDKNVRYVHVHENEAPDDALLAGWIKQASELPGWTP